MAAPGKELASLDFEALIGGPLVAVIHAQCQAAIATVNFVKTVGFEPAVGSPTNQVTGKPSMITFKYSKGVDDERSENELSMPFLTLLPIPNLRIDEVTLDFMAKVNSVNAKSIDAGMGAGQSNSGAGSAVFNSAGMKVTSTFQRQTKEGNVVTRDYSMNIRVRAVQDDLPAGMDRLISVLEQGIKEIPDKKKAAA
mmetsp:Transcript_37364/g.93862  ORF Transcript_37364/g.93862 Transcript_37364/m.93862 type:complete len:196 (-) Transcript_37364:226-813(-)|eukprot:CAMPEP_0177660094 /NCGR_PEP_ID=MMETSP0447-20121125/17818_1 /TAXON_ID=0 /ORGANISM="Stygamoeba regulata, Strain BSH-02190019" /LENGTH=195 /DNA_ID=CAMNT_0019165059 /DNA_START=59 /DNA_END=646 /DNA_ORIENTATION=+